MDLLVDDADFLLHQLDVGFQFLYLAVQLGEEAAAFLGRGGEEAKVVFVGLQLGFQRVAATHQLFAFAVERLCTTGLDVGDGRLEVGELLAGCLHVEAVEQLVHKGAVGFV